MRSYHQSATGVSCLLFIHTFVDSVPCDHITSRPLAFLVCCLFTHLSTRFLAIISPVGHWRFLSQLFIHTFVDSVPCDHITSRPLAFLVCCLFTHLSTRFLAIISPVGHWRFLSAVYSHICRLGSLRSYHQSATGVSCLLFIHTFVDSVPCDHITSRPLAFLVCCLFTHLSTQFLAIISPVGHWRFLSAVYSHICRLSSLRSYHQSATGVSCLLFIHTFVDSVPCDHITSRPLAFLVCCLFTHLSTQFLAIISPVGHWRFLSAVYSHICRLGSLRSYHQSATGVSCLLFILTSMANKMLVYMTWAARSEAVRFGRDLNSRFTTFLDEIRFSGPRIYSDVSVVSHTNLQQLNITVCATPML